MCFFNSMSKKAKELAARYGRKSDIIEIAQEILDEQYRVSAFTNPDCPVVTSDSEIQLYKWGLIPFWTKDEDAAKEIRKMTYNAKAETLFQKPSYREPIKKRRCLIPATGFFEWRDENGIKLPYYIYVKNEPIFSMAGIWDTWTDHTTGEILHTFSQITTEANRLMSYIHNLKQRMPAILSNEDEEKWLDPALDKDEIEKLLQPFPDNKMVAYRISRDFLKKYSHDKSILESENPH